MKKYWRFEFASKRNVCVWCASVRQEIRQQLLCFLFVFLLIDRIVCIPPPLSSQHTWTKKKKRKEKLVQSGDADGDDKKGRNKNTTTPPPPPGHHTHTPQWSMLARRDHASCIDVIIFRYCCCLGCERALFVVLAFVDGGGVLLLHQPLDLLPPCARSVERSVHFVGVQHHEEDGQTTGEGCATNEQHNGNRVFPRGILNRTRSCKKKKNQRNPTERAHT